MLRFFMLLSIIAFFTLSVFLLVHNLEERTSKGKSNKAYVIFLSILVTIFAIGGIDNSILSSIYLTEPEISYIEIDNVYVSTETMDITYFVEYKSGEHHTLKFVNVCKGDSNYIISYTYPNLNKTVAFLTGKNQKEYVLVLKDPYNIPTLKSIDS